MNFYRILDELVQQCDAENTCIYLITCIDAKHNLELFFILSFMCFGLSVKENIAVDYNIYNSHNFIVGL